MRHESETTAGVSLCLFFGRGRDFDFRFCLRFQFSVHKLSFGAESEVSAQSEKFPLPVPLPGSVSFGQLGQARTAADGADGMGIAAELPSFCRRFSVSFSLAVSVFALRPGKMFRLPPTLDALKRSAFCALRKGNDTTRTENRSTGLLAPLASM